MCVACALSALENRRLRAIRLNLSTAYPCCEDRSGSPRPVTGIPCRLSRVKQANAILALTAITVTEYLNRPVIASSLSSVTLLVYFCPVLTSAV